MTSDGLRQAIALANTTLDTIPAYRDFVKKSGYKGFKVNSPDDFFRLPISSKNNYIQQYKLTKLFPATKALPVAYASSGSSGKPTFWFRSESQEQRAINAHEKILNKIFFIKKHEPTLVVICFSMGIWVAGNFTYTAFRELAKQGYNITVATPGIDKQDIYSTLKNLTPHYKNLILAGYPPFIMEIIHACKDQKIPLPQRTRILTSGETFSESWRDKVLELTGNTIETDIINLYGSADGGALGSETPLSIKLRRMAISNHVIRQSLFGDSTIEPAFFQYNPSDIYFEAINNELIFTANTGIPLVRYNLRDTGSIVQTKSLISLLNKERLLNKELANLFKKWDQPFIVKKGRNDVSVTYYALNIFPENIRMGVEDKRISKFLTGNFLAYNQNNKNYQNHTLHITLELTPSSKAKPAILKKIQEIITEQLLKNNIEYRKLHHTLGKRTTPKIHLVPSGTHAFQKTKGLLSIIGKKPKIIS